MSLAAENMKDEESIVIVDGGLIEEDDDDVQLVAEYFSNDPLRRVQREYPNGPIVDTRPSKNMCLPSEDRMEVSENEVKDGIVVVDGDEQDEDDDVQLVAAFYSNDGSRNDKRKRSFGPCFGEGPARRMSLVTPKMKVQEINPNEDEDGIVIIDDDTKEDRDDDCQVIDKYFLKGIRPDKRRLYSSISDEEDCICLGELDVNGTEYMKSFSKGRSDGFFKRLAEMEKEEGKIIEEAQEDQDGFMYLLNLHSTKTDITEAHKKHSVKRKASPPIWFGSRYDSGHRVTKVYVSQLPSLLLIPRLVKEGVLPQKFLITSSQMNKSLENISWYTKTSYRTSGGRTGH